MFNPKYQITDQILSWLSDIAEIRGKIAQLKLMPVRETMLRRSAVIKMAHSSTSIEGNPLSEKQVEQLASKSPIVAPAKDQLEVNNYFAALDHVTKLASKKIITQADILSLHNTTMSKLLPKNKLGKFRSTPVYIVNSQSGKPDNIVYTPPTPTQAPQLIEDLLVWHNNAHTIHPVIRAGILHYQFESIHPFVDGNGRTGRLLTLLSLYQSGWDFRRGLVLEEHYNLDRRAYYQALQDRQQDLTSWLTFFVQGFWLESLRLQESVLSLISSGKPLSENNLDSNDLKIIDFVLTLKQIGSSDVADILNIPLRTAQSRLARLVQFRILKKYGSGPSSHYMLAKVK